MSHVLVAAIMLAAFLLTIALVRVLCRVIDRDGAPAWYADEPPDTNGRADASNVDPAGRHDRI